jgi:hypothetical protein
MKIVTSLTSQLLPLLAFAFSSNVFASGGPVGETIIECGGVGHPHLMVFRLKETYSSETRGDALVYPGSGQRNAMTTSMDDCWDLYLVDSPSVPTDLVNESDKKEVVVCGNAEADKDAKKRVVVRPNKNGFLAILNNASKKGRIIQTKGEKNRDGSQGSSGSTPWVSCKVVR